MNNRIVALIGAFFMSACVPEDGAVSPDTSAAKPAATATAPTANVPLSAYSKYVGGWGLGSCLDPEATRGYCNKPILIISENATATILSYNPRSGAVKDKMDMAVRAGANSTINLVLSGDSPSEEELVATLSFGKEVGIPVLNFQFSAVAGGERHKYVSVANLRRGFEVKSPESNQYVINYAASNGGGGSGLSIGANPSSVSLSGQCGLPLAQVSQADRQRWHSEASKQISFGPFQSDAAARREILSLSTPAGYSSVCEATGKQVYAFLPSLNGAIEASNRLHNGPPIGLRCLGGGGASHRSACQATQLVYAMKTVAYMCHQVCN